MTAGNFARRPLRLVTALATFVAAVLTISPAIAAIGWHGSYTAAQGSSQASSRPVLVVFTASWCEACQHLDATLWSNAEAAAFVTACYEPVLVDVDADPELARRLGISHLPSACVVSSDGRLIASFDVPTSSAGFIAAAARGLQGGPASPRGPTVATTVAPATEIPSSPWRSTSVASPTSSFTTAPPATGATSAASEAWSAPATGNGYPPVSPPAEAVSRGFIEPPASPPVTYGMAPPAEQSYAAIPAVPPSTATPHPTQTSPSPTGSAATATDRSGMEDGKEGKKSNSFLAALQKPFTYFMPSSKSADDAGASAHDASSVPVPYPVGLDGYCPVTLAEQATWIEGRAQWGAQHRGRTYLFAGQNEQQRFMANPDRYAPALSGDDAVLAFEAGQQVPGQRRYGVTYQARIYLFSSLDTRSRFAANPQAYASRVRLAESTGGGTGTLVR